MVHKASTSLVNGRGQRLHTVQYLPAGQPKALVVFHHGYGEHTGRYDYGEKKLSLALSGQLSEDAPFAPWAPTDIATLPKKCSAMLAYVESMLQCLCKIAACSPFL